MRIKENYKNIYLKIGDTRKKDLLVPFEKIGSEANKHLKLQLEFKNK